MAKWLEDHLPEALWAALAGLVAWTAKRVWGYGGRISGLDRRITKLESTAITHANMDELRRSITSSVVNSHERIEERMDKILMHLAEKK